MVCRLRSAPVVVLLRGKTWLKVRLEETGLDSLGLFSQFLTAGGLNEELHKRIKTVVSNRCGRKAAEIAVESRSDSKR